MKRFLVAAVSLILLAGCATSEEANSGFSPSDINFAEMMILHHKQAIEMAMDVKDSESKVVADLSAAIIKQQEIEIAAMNELLLKG